MTASPSAKARHAEPQSAARDHERGRIDQPFDLPDALPLEFDPDDWSDLDDIDWPIDDEDWEVFTIDDDYDLEPDASDFWGEPDDAETSGEHG